MDTLDILESVGIVGTQELVAGVVQVDLADTLGLVELVVTQEFLDLVEQVDILESVDGVESVDTLVRVGTLVHLVIQESVGLVVCLELD